MKQTLNRISLILATVALLVLIYLVITVHYQPQPTTVTAAALSPEDILLNSPEAELLLNRPPEEGQLIIPSVDPTPAQFESAYTQYSIVRSTSANNFTKALNDSLEVGYEVQGEMHLERTGASTYDYVQLIAKPRY